jgi:hypothetical protein
MLSAIAQPELGNEALTQRYGYLRANPYYNVVDPGGYFEVLPMNPAYIYVPTDDPLVVFGPPQPGFVIGGAIHSGRPS